MTSPRASENPLLMTSPWESLFDDVIKNSLPHLFIDDVIDDVIAASTAIHPERNAQHRVFSKSRDFRHKLENFPSPNIRMTVIFQVQNSQCKNSPSPRSVLKNPVHNSDPDPIHNFGSWVSIRIRFAKFGSGSGSQISDPVQGPTDPDSRTRPQQYTHLVHDPKSTNISSTTPKVQTSRPMTSVLKFDL